MEDDNNQKNREPDRNLTTPEHVEHVVNEIKERGAVPEDLGNFLFKADIEEVNKVLAKDGLEIGDNKDEELELRKRNLSEKDISKIAKMIKQAVEVSEEFDDYVLEKSDISKINGILKKDGLQIKDNANGDLELTKHSKEYVGMEERRFLGNIINKMKTTAGLAKEEHKEVSPEEYSAANWTKEKFEQEVGTDVEYNRKNVKALVREKFEDDTGIKLTQENFKAHSSGEMDMSPAEVLKKAGITTGAVTAESGQLPKQNGNGDLPDRSNPKGV